MQCHNKYFYFCYRNLAITFKSQIKLVTGLKKGAYF